MIKLQLGLYAFFGVFIYYSDNPADNYCALLQKEPGEAACAKDVD